MARCGEGSEKTGYVPEEELVVVLAFKNRSACVGCARLMGFNVPSFRSVARGGELTLWGAQRTF